MCTEALSDGARWWLGCIKVLVLLQIFISGYVREFGDPLSVYMNHTCI